ncbi:MAG: hypothetical protein ACR2NX_01550 [Chthoniobacterales bacterium]
MRIFLIGLCFLAVTARAQDCDPQAAAQAMLENEARFVALGQEKDARTASLEFLADDAIMLEPGPVNARKTWNERKAAPLSLQWKPSFGAMARSCDLGFTTGPAEWRRNKGDEKPLGYGQYISVWKKQKDDTWKVVVDVGGPVPSPQKIEGPPEIAISPAPTTKPNLKEAAKKLRAAQKWFTNTAKTDSTSALVGSSSESVRVDRSGVLPGVGREPVELMLSVLRGKLTLEGMGGDMSAAGDLAYRYGKYTLALSQKTEHGYYLQIWQTDAAGAWKILLDYQSPLREIKTISE